MKNFNKKGHHNLVYNHFMETNLTIEQSNALNASSEHRLTVLDPITMRRYVIVDELRLSKLESIEAVRAGIAQMEIGQGQPLSEAIDDVREQLRRRA